MDKFLSAKIFSQVPTDMEEDEMYQIINKVEELNPKVIVEIGVKNGGSLNFWRKITPDSGMVIGIDSCNEVEKIILEDNKVKFIEGDSLDYKTYQDFIKILNNLEIDFLFIDGGHVYRETKSDFYTFGWHVRKDGWIGFHDIFLDSEKNSKGSTKQFWEEIVNRSGKYWEVIYESKIHTGTGIIKKKF